MSLAAKLVLSPLLVAQALATRRRLPRLPEADGPREGVVGDGPVALRLLIGGDSSAAGVGVATQDEALAGQTARPLAEGIGAAVAWRLVARSGLTTAQCADLLAEAAEPWHVDVAVFALGVNDVIEQVPARRAIAARERLVAHLHEQARVRHVIFMPLPPVHRFPGLPQPLRWVMGADARRHDTALARWAARRDDVSHIPIDLPLDPRVMASDGFHPGEPVYRLCGLALAEHIATHVWPRLQRQESPR
ncbi:MAG: SGNH/GDSL hydrolase family protein [Burkholderiaceae bacterium]|nr:SGNH/GDSL hydrolase family protein [Burkholderiaceae bacterium]